MVKAKVFISCGQSTDEEKKYGLVIYNHLKGKYDAYFAQEVHTAKALTEHIFNALMESEYYVSVNFPRPNSKVGSLFVQQELAIATFLNIPIIPFNVGKIDLEGVSKYLLLNIIQVNSPEELIQELDRQTKKWDPNSKNQLRLSFNNHTMNFLRLDQNGNKIKDEGGTEVKDDWYHITAHNLSSRINVRNCFGYVESIVEDGNEIFNNDDYKSELIWAGTGRININLPKGSKRDLDAFNYNYNLK
ncbi:MAG: hypothetical protein KJ709_08185, partial [Nanoarchaeota archaeon]|nr:hypothetical protein [Nanoarchaeota archaeon]